MRMRHVALVPIAVLILTLHACAASVSLAGRWEALPFDTLALAPVVLQEDGIGGGHPAVCREAPKEIGQRLLKGLPARLAPVKLAADVVPTPQMGVLELRIERCFVDSYTYGSSDSPNFFLTLQTAVVLRHEGRVVMQRRFQTDEAVYHPNAPTPDFEFSFSDPVRVVLGMFSEGRVLLP